MFAESIVPVSTPLFRQALENAGVTFDVGARGIFFDPSKPEKMLLAFRLLAETGKDPSVWVLDVGCFPEETPWAFVSDAVGRSGSNPLRGLGRIMKEPFVDVCRLYRVPRGAAGVEVIALGDRYRDSLDQSPPDADTRPICSHLHGAAILAHTEGLRVTGVLVSEATIPNFNLDQVLQD
jgi:hypothetical protein